MSHNPKIAAILAKLRAEKAAALPNPNLPVTPPSLPDSDPNSLGARLSRMRDKLAAEALEKEAKAKAHRERVANSTYERGPYELAENKGANTKRHVPIPTPDQQGFGTIEPSTSSTQDSTLGMHGEEIEYNSEQEQFIHLGGNGESCVLIGAAGTGKTTCSKGAIEALIANTNNPPLDSIGHKHLTSGTPGVLIIAYTRRAVNNIRKVQTPSMQKNCLTAHKLLEFAPEYYDILDPNTGLMKSTMRFIPQRNRDNPLPNTIHTIIIEEASMLGLDLYLLLAAALQHPVQWILIGDLQQLPPVFGPAILGFKINELPTVELTHVYRQALESPIIRLAHRIISGKPILPAELPEWNFTGQLTIKPWKREHSGIIAAKAVVLFLEAAAEKGLYDIAEDMIICPFNHIDYCGTLQINKGLATNLARKRELYTYEVQAGRETHYYSIGDKILYDREDAVITAIEPNPAYLGKRVQPRSKHLDYWGYNPNLGNDLREAGLHESELGDTDIDTMLNAMSSGEDKVNQASHEITLELTDSGTELKICSSKDLNSTMLGYALTVHKAQGSEWRRVIVVIHKEHNRMVNRELLYTAVTRAREELVVICEDFTFDAGIKAQKIKGNTLLEKAEYFKGKHSALSTKYTSELNDS